MASVRYLFSALLLALPLNLAAQTAWTITPDHGPTSGGQEVIVKGSFGAWPYSLIFGSASVPATRIDDSTLRAFTPPHPAGTVDLVVFEYDMGISTGLEYTFNDDGKETFDRVLLPILTPPVFGAHGSEFRTDFRAFHRNSSPMLAYGLLSDCGGAPCFESEDRGLYIASNGEIGAHNTVWMSGGPGAFVWVPRAIDNELSMQLRVYDVSREATNFGTQIPVVHEDEMRSTPVTLLGVPTDARFRNTLRIYATEPGMVLVLIEGTGYSAEHQVELTPGDAFHPAYAAFADFPIAAGDMRVSVAWPPEECCIDPVPEPPPIWAFITVTNNDTQHITVISPQR